MVEEGNQTSRLHESLLMEDEEVQLAQAISPQDGHSAFQFCTRAVPSLDPPLGLCRTHTLEGPVPLLYGHSFPGARANLAPLSESSSGTGPAAG